MEQPRCECKGSLEFSQLKGGVGMAWLRREGVSIIKKGNSQKARGLLVERTVFGSRNWRPGVPVFVMVK